MWHENSVTYVLNIKYPIIQAPMAGGVTTPELIAAVSNAGGLGMLGAGYMSPEEIQKNIQEIKQLTKNPFGVNLFIPETSELNQEEMEKAIELLRPFREELNITTAPEVKKTT